MTATCGAVNLRWCVRRAPAMQRRSGAPLVVSFHRPNVPVVGSDELRIQLDQLRAEAESTRSKANSARLRLMRLTDAAENLQRRAARSIQVGKENEARELLVHKKKLMQALEKSKNRIEVLDKLSAKITEAISLKETQLIGKVAIQPEDDRSESCGNIHFVLPKDDAVEMSNSGCSEQLHEHILENIDMKLRLVETDIESFIRSQSSTEETKRHQNVKLLKMSEILKDVLSIRERISSMMETKTDDI